MKDLGFRGERANESVAHGPTLTKPDFGLAIGSVDNVEIGVGFGWRVQRDDRLLSSLWEAAVSQLLIRLPTGCPGRHGSLNVYLLGSAQHAGNRLCGVRLPTLVEEALSLRALSKPRARIVVHPWGDAGVASCEGDNLGPCLAERLPSFAPPFPLTLTLASRCEFRNGACLLKLRDRAEHLAHQNSRGGILGEKSGADAGMIEMPSDLSMS